MPNKDADPEHEGKKDADEKPKAGIYEYYEATISLVKIVIWPMLIVCFLLAFNGPVARTVDQLPTVVARASSFKVGDLSVELEKQLLVSASPAVRNALTGRSAGALRMLVKYGSVNHLASSTSPVYKQDEPTLKELQTAGLFYIKPYTSSDHPDLDIDYGPTAVGKEAYQFVVDLMIAELLPPTLPENK